MYFIGLIFIADVFFCRHCKDIIPTLDDVEHHICFEGKEVFLENKELYSPAVNGNLKPKKLYLFYKYKTKRFVKIFYDIPIN